MRISLKGAFDKRGLYGLGDYDPTFKKIQIDMDIEGEITEEQAKELVRWVRTCCTMFNTVRKAVRITENVYLSGRPVDIPAIIIG